MAVIIPALDEERALGSVIDAVPDWVDRIVVADNGSTDRTADVAREHGAEVVFEPRRGYGAACLAGMAALPRPGVEDAPRTVVFLDGDFSDDPTEMASLIDPIRSEGYDLVIGSRVLGDCQPGALTPIQRFGNGLSCFLIRHLFGVTYTDLGPFRAVDWAALEALEMDDPAYGWTVQMQVRAASRALRTTEVPVSYRNRAAGRSKVSGTLRGVVGAGSTILYVIFREALATIPQARSRSRQTSR